MKKNFYEGFTDEKLFGRKQLLKSVVLGWSLVFLLAIGILIYLRIANGLKGTSTSALPIWIVTFIPLLINIGLIDKETKARNV